MGQNEIIKKIKELVELCNKYRDAYYNHNELVSDEVYDRYFDELTNLENKTGFKMVNSPTQSVGYVVSDNLPKVKHNIPLLSLAKTKSIEDVVKFAGNKDVLYMVKADGLTTKITYKSDGHTATLEEAATRGSGYEGSFVTNNIKTYQNIPLTITYPNDLVIVGESVILKSDFDELNNSLPDDEKYANQRNLASGSISLLDSAECAKRHLRFYAFDVLSGIDGDSLYEKLCIAQQLGFETVYFGKTNGMGVKEWADIIKTTHNYADDNGFPCDGVVIKYDSVSYGASLGNTSHHFNNGIAKKEEDDLIETIFRGIEWHVSKDGNVCPVGLFDEVNVADAQVSRATLHNLDYIDGLKLHVGNRICVSKRNLIIPAIEVNLDYNSDNYELPLINKCPDCGTDLTIIKPNNTRLLYCPNENCPARLLGKLETFVSKKAMNIMGLSTSILQFLIDRGWVKNFIDIYRLVNHGAEWERCEGFGRTSVGNILTAIEKSRTVDLAHFITALSIPTIGSTASKLISDYCGGDFNKFVDATLGKDKTVKSGFSWTSLPTFGETMARNIDNWIGNYGDNMCFLADEMHFITNEKQEVKENPFLGKTIVVTGALTNFTRDTINAKIAEIGAKTSGSVSKKTDYVLTNEASGSSKYRKAIELNVPVISEDEFLRMIGE